MHIHVYEFMGICSSHDYIFIHMSQSIVSTPFNFFFVVIIFAFVVALG